MRKDGQVAIAIMRPCRWQSSMILSFSYFTADFLLCLSARHFSILLSFHFFSFVFLFVFFVFWNSPPGLLSPISFLFSAVILQFHLWITSPALALCLWYSSNQVDDPLSRWKQQPGGAPLPPSLPYGRNPIRIDGTVTETLLMVPGSFQVWRIVETELMLMDADYPIPSHLQPLGNKKHGQASDFKRGVISHQMTQFILIRNNRQK